MVEEKRPRILIVDDEAPVRQSLAIALGEVGYEAVTAATAAEGLAVHGAARCDLLLVDKNLPDESGLDFVRRLRARGDGVPVVIMTAYGSVESAISAVTLRIAAYVEKPFEDLFSIPRLVEQVLARERERANGSGSTAASHFRKAQAALAAGATPVRADSPRVLVVGPDAAVRKTVAFWLGRGDVAIQEKASGPEALAAMAAWSPDLIVVDAAVSPDVFAILEQAQGRVPCVVLADHPTLSTVARLIRLDVAAILEMPLAERDVRDRIEAILQQLRPSDQA